MSVRKKKVTRKSAKKKVASRSARARSTKKTVTAKRKPTKKAVSQKVQPKSSAKNAMPKSFRSKTTTVGSMTLASPQYSYHGHDLFFAFITGMIMTLAMQGTFTNAGEAVASALTIPPHCSVNEDCKSPTVVCEANTCVELYRPVGRCLHTAILTYTERGGRTKHTFCENGCTNTPRGPRCL